MSEFVLDASVSLSWFVDRPVPQAASKVLDLLVKGSVGKVPGLWLLEMANGFLTAERRRILSAEDTLESCEQLELLLATCLEIDAEAAPPLLRGMVRTGRLYGLTAYDASYLALAQEAKLPLATLDRGLQVAAKRAGVRLLP